MHKQQKGRQAFFCTFLDPLPHYLEAWSRLTVSYRMQYLEIIKTFVRNIQWALREYPVFCYLFCWSSSSTKHSSSSLFSGCLGNKALYIGKQQEFPFISLSTITKDPVGSLLSISSFMWLSFASCNVLIMSFEDKGFLFFSCSLCNSFSEIKKHSYCVFQGG